MTSSPPPCVGPRLLGGIRPSSWGAFCSRCAPRISFSPELPRLIALLQVLVEQAFNHEDAEWIRKWRDVDGLPPRGLPVFRARLEERIAALAAGAEGSELALFSLVCYNHLGGESLLVRGRRSRLKESLPLGSHHLLPDGTLVVTSTALFEPGSHELREIGGERRCWPVGQPFALSDLRPCALGQVAGLYREMDSTPHEQSLLAWLHSEIDQLRNSPHDSEQAELLLTLDGPITFDHPEIELLFTAAFQLEMHKHPSAAMLQRVNLFRDVQRVRYHRGH